MSAMNSFDSLISDFAEKTGVPLDSARASAGSVDLVVDGIDVSVLYRPDRDDCVMFTLPLGDMVPEPPMERRALELSANGAGTDGHFLGIKAGAFVLSSVASVNGLSAEDFATRLVSLANATRRVAESLALAVAEGLSDAGDSPANGEGVAEANPYLRV